MIYIITNKSRESNIPSFPKDVIPFTSLIKAPENLKKRLAFIGLVKNKDAILDLQNQLSNGQTLPASEVAELLKTNPTLTIDSDVLVYKERFLNSMFFRAFIGWSAPDIGRPIQDGIPGITGTITQEQLAPLPGWNLTHFKLVKSAGYRDAQLRMLKYYDGATIQGTIAE